MEDLLISPYWLAVLFFVVATFYSMTGLGGGTSYAALLGVFGAGTRAIPTISLGLNALVSLIVSFTYVRAGYARWRLIGVLLAGSAPMAYLGGWLPISEDVFYVVLIGVLLLVAARILLWADPRLDVKWSGRWRLGASLAMGAVIGFLSGLVGIGGGVFLVPALVILGLADEREAAAAGGIFIFVNSLAGLGAHLQYYIPAAEEIIPLAAAVIVGSVLGSYLGAVRLKERTIRWIMGGIILIAAVILSVQFLTT